MNNGKIAPVPPRRIEPKIKGRLIVSLIDTGNGTEVSLTIDDSIPVPPHHVLMDMLIKSLGLLDGPMRKMFKSGPQIMLPPGGNIPPLRLPPIK